MGDPVHGASTGVAAHNRRHESFCLPCANYAADRNRAYAVASNQRKTVQVSVLGLGRILNGADAGEVLAAEFGPLAMAALRKLGAGEQRG